MKKTLLFMLLAALFGCHQDPIVPDSIIPAGCKIGMVETIDEITTSRKTNTYNAFGSLIKETYVAGTAGYVNDYTYDADRYLTGSKKTPTTGTPTTETYTYDDQKRIRQVLTNGSVTEQFDYLGDKLTTYTTKSSSGSSVSTYTFSDGKLTAITIPNGTVSVSNTGRTTSTTYTDGTVASIDYDTKGQLTRYGYTSPTYRFLLTITYDTRSSPDIASLRQRGWPALEFFSEPQSNYANYTFQDYVSNTLTTNLKYTYTYDYNKQGFPTRQYRSDGYREKYYYTNCP